MGSPARTRQSHEVLDDLLDARRIRHRRLHAAEIGPVGYPGEGLGIIVRPARRLEQPLEIGQPVGVDLVERSADIGIDRRPGPELQLQPPGGQQGAAHDGREAVEPDGGGMVFRAELRLHGIGPLGRRLNKREFDAVELHMAEEGRNLKALLEGASDR